MSLIEFADRDAVLREAWRIVEWVETIDDYTGRQKARKAARRLARFLDAVTHTGAFEPFDRPAFVAVAYAVIEGVYLARKFGAKRPEAVEATGDQVVEDLGDDDDDDQAGDQVDEAGDDDSDDDSDEGDPVG